MSLQFKGLKFKVYEVAVVTHISLLRLANNYKPAGILFLPLKSGARLGIPISSSARPPRDDSEPSIAIACSPYPSIPFCIFNPSRHILFIGQGWRMNNRSTIPVLVFIMLFHTRLSQHLYSNLEDSFCSCSWSVLQIHKRFCLRQAPVAGNKSEIRRHNHFCQSGLRHCPYSLPLNAIRLIPAW